MAKAMACAAVLAGGCAQIFGLDPTERRDGGGLCAVDLTCDGAPDRSICGRLVDATTELPFAVAGATGAACDPLMPATEGPCAFEVSGQSAGELFLGGGTPTPAALVDDCGRFRIEGVAGTDLAVLAVPGPSIATLYRRVARTILYTDTGNVDDISVPVISEAVVAGWEAQAPAGTEVEDGFLLRFRNGSSPIQDVTVRVDNNQVNDPPSKPFALYFAGSAPFDTVVEGGDAPVLKRSSGATGTGYLNPGTGGQFSLGGTRPGRQCDAAAVGMVNRVAGFLIWVELTNC